VACAVTFCSHYSCCIISVLWMGPGSCNLRDFAVVVQPLNYMAQSNRYLRTTTQVLRSPYHCSEETFSWTGGKKDFVKKVGIGEGGTDPETTCILCCISTTVGPGSSFGKATDYGLEGPGIEFRWGRDFPPVQTGPGAHPASRTIGTGSFPEVKCCRGVLQTTHPF